MTTYEECLAKIRRIQREGDFPQCPKCGSLVNEMFPTKEGRVVFRCSKCKDPHENPWAGYICGPTEFILIDGQPKLVTPGFSEFA